MIKISFVAQGTTWTEPMETYARNTITSGMRRVTGLAEGYTVKISIIKKRTKMTKVELSGGGFRAQCINDDFYKAMSDVVSKFKALVLKHAKRLLTNKRKTAVATDIVEDLDMLEPLYSKEKIFILEPCSIFEAIKQFNQTDYSFYTFRDLDYNNEIAILYRRFDDSVGIIRCK